MSQCQIESSRRIVQSRAAESGPGPSRIPPGSRIARIRPSSPRIRSLLPFPL